MRAGILLMLFILVALSPVQPPGGHEPFARHSLILDGLSWESHSIVCGANEMLEGYFEATSDGSLYPGDEQKYDDWVPTRIDFSIMSAPEFSRFEAGNSSYSVIEMDDVSEGSWSLRIPEAGEWFLVYYNPTIYLVQIEARTLQTDWSLMATSALFILPLGIAILVGVLLRNRKG